MARLPHRATRHSSRIFLPLALFLLPTLVFLGCSTALNRNIAATNPPNVRVRLLMNLDKLAVVASERPVFRTDSDPTPRLLDLPRNTPIVFSLSPAGWRVGGTTLGSGTLIIQPAGEGTVAIAPV